MSRLGPRFEVELPANGRKLGHVPEGDVHGVVRGVGFEMAGEQHVWLTVRYSGDWPRVSETTVALRLGEVQQVIDGLTDVVRLARIEEGTIDG